MGNDNNTSPCIPGSEASRGFDFTFAPGIAPSVCNNVSFAGAGIRHLHIQAQRLVLRFLAIGLDGYRGRVVLLFHLIVV